jgi:hypothetical protein
MAFKWQWPSATEASEGDSDADAWDFDRKADDRAGGGLGSDGRAYDEKRSKSTGDPALTERECSRQLNALWTTASIGLPIPVLNYIVAAFAAAPNRTDASHRHVWRGTTLIFPADPLCGVRCRSDRLCGSCSAEFVIRSYLEHDCGERSAVPDH